MSSDNPYGGPPSGPYGQGGQPPDPYGQGGQPPGPYGQGSPAGPPPPYGYPPPPQPPPPGSGYAFGPFAGPPGQPGGPQGQPQPQPPYGNAPGPYGPGQPPPPTDPPRRRGKVLIIVGALVLALIVGAIAVALLNRDDPIATQPPATASQNPSGAATSAPPTSAPPAAKASDAVVGYLEALAAGSAATALSYGVDPVSGPLLTDQVLAQSIKRAPLSGIEVDPVDDQQAQTVTAAYRLGKTPVNTVFDVVKVVDDWKLVEVVKRVDVGLSRAKSVPMVVNGTKVSGNTVSVLPGSYAFSTGLSTISYGSKNVVLVKGPTDYVDTYNLKVQLSKSGKKAAVATAKKRYKRCLAAKSLKPKNCPFSFKSKYNYIERTIRWRQGGKDPFRKAKVSFNATIAQVSIPLNVKVSGDCTFNGGSGTCSGGVTGNGLALVSMTKKPLKARWL